MTDIDLMNRLDAAGKTPLHISPALMARVLADASAAQLAAHPAPNVTPMHTNTLRAPVRAPLRAPGRTPGRNWGWVSGAAVAASALLGLGFGYSGTDTLLALPGIGDALAGYSTTLGSRVDELGALDTFLAEG